MFLTRCGPAFDEKGCAAEYLAVRLVTESVKKLGRYGCLAINSDSIEP